MKFYLFGTLRTRFLMQLVLLAGFFVSVSVVRADLITFRYEGELTSVDTALEGQFSVGDSFGGTYTFDSNTPMASIDKTNIDNYYPNAIVDMQFTSGSYMASSNNGLLNQFAEEVENWVFSTKFKSISGSSIESFSPSEMNLYWNTPSWFETSVINPDPHFNPYSPTPWEILMPIINGGNFFPDEEPDLIYYDVNGNMVYPNSNTEIPNYNQDLFDSDGILAYNGKMSILFRRQDNQEDRLTLRGRLKSVTLVSNIPSISVTNNKWIQIGLKTAPPVGSTVADIIGDDISASYGSEWVLYSYETSTNSYRKLSPTDTMLTGIGYWFIQTTGNPVTIDMPDESTDVNVRQSPACSSFEGCFEIPLQTSDSYKPQWQMIGYPFRDNGEIDKIRVVTAGIGSDCFTGCTLAQANGKYLVSEPLYHYNGTSYQQLTTEGSEPFEPWDGAWIATLPYATGQNPTLLIPATN